MRDPRGKCSLLILCRSTSIQIKIILRMNRLIKLNQNMQALDPPVKLQMLPNSIMKCTLNKPKALNALDHHMIKLLYSYIKQWNADPYISTVILCGEGKAFCAGADVKSLYLAKREPKGIESQQLLENIFRDEYTMDYAMATMRSTLIAIMDGIVMGGGVGISINAKIRIATETTLFAMPEGKLGLFTDVGGGYFLPRMKHNLGMFVALTGYRLKGADLIHTGLADHYIVREKIPSLIQELTSNSENIETIISKYSHRESELPPFSISPEDLKIIQEVFTDEKDLKHIFDTLESHPNQTLLKPYLDILNSSCPISLRVIFEQLKRGKNLSYKDNLIMDLRIATRFMQNEDFFEGVKTTLVDKQHKQQWTFTDARTIPEQEVQAFFQKLERDLEI